MFSVVSVVAAVTVAMEALFLVVVGRDGKPIIPWCWWCELVGLVGCTLADEHCTFPGIFLPPMADGVAILSYHLFYPHAYPKLGMYPLKTSTS